MKMRRMPADVVMDFAFVILMSAGVFLHASPSEERSGSSAVIARVNGSPVDEGSLEQKLEEIYPTASVHGNRGGSPELRQKALDAVILDELIWQQAVKAGKVVPLTTAQQELSRIRLKYGAQVFDADLQQSGVSRRQYVQRLQRALTIREVRKQHVDIPSRVGPREVRAYYEGNLNRFHRPERVHFRLILVAVEPNASEDTEQQAKKKAAGLYAQLKEGKDFGDLAYEFSDDVYRATGGDVGWMHKGSMDAEFEPIALTLPIGQFTAPFRTSLGFSIMKVETREASRVMTFAEVHDRLKMQLTAIKSKQLQQAWEGELKKNARIEMVDTNVGLQTLNGPPVEALAPKPTH